MTPEETLKRLIHQAESALELVEAGLVTLNHKDQLGLLPPTTFIVGDFEICDKKANTTLWKIKRKDYHKQTQHDPHTPG